MLKSLRGRVVDMCKHAFGHMVLLAVFDCVDDTVLVQKVILDVSGVWTVILSIVMTTSFL